MIKFTVAVKLWFKLVNNFYVDADKVDYKIYAIFSMPYFTLVRGPQSTSFNTKNSFHPSNFY